MKTELEEAAEREFPLMDTEQCRTGVAEEENLHLLGHRRSFIKGAKWQAERMYNEQDMIDFAMFYYTHQGKATKYWGKDLFKEWFEQFKKK